MWRETEGETWNGGKIELEQEAGGLDRKGQYEETRMLGEVKERYLQAEVIRCTGVACNSGRGRRVREEGRLHG